MPQHSFEDPQNNDDGSLNKLTGREIREIVLIQALGMLNIGAIAVCDGVPLVLRVAATGLTFGAMAYPFMQKPDTGTPPES